MVDQQRRTDTATQSPVKMSDCIEHIKLQGLQGGVKTNPHCDLSFLCASAAEVEHLWSKALHIFVQQRRKMCPHLLEALLFLKKNRRFWDKAMVMEAMETRKEVGNEEEIKLDSD